MYPVWPIIHSYSKVSTHKEIPDSSNDKWFSFFTWKYSQPPYMDKIKRNENKKLLIYIDSFAILKTHQQIGSSLSTSDLWIICWKVVYHSLPLPTSRSNLPTLQMETWQTSPADCISTRSPPQIPSLQLNFQKVFQVLGKYGNTTLLPHTTH